MMGVIHVSKNISHATLHGGTAGSRRETKPWKSQATVHQLTASTNAAVSHAQGQGEGEGERTGQSNATATVTSSRNATTIQSKGKGQEFCNGERMFLLREDGGM